MIAKRYRISNSADYNKVYKKGKKIPGKYIIVYILNNELGYNRFGIVTSKKVGKAVIRNKIKRQLRAILKRNMDYIKNGYDIVIVGRYNIGGIEFDLLDKDFTILMRKSGLWYEK